MAIPSGPAPDSRIGVALIWIANAMRIAGLLLIGNAGAPQVALGGFHSQAGWIAFNAVAIGICLLARRIPALMRPEHTQSGSRTLQPHRSLPDAFPG